MTSRIGRYAAAMTVLAFGSCGGAQPRAESAESTRDVATAEADGGQATQAPPSTSRSQELDVSTLGVDRGSADAPVRVLEMSDYGCGYCRKFHMETWPVLQKDFVDSGKIEWKFLPFVTGMFKNSPHALTAAECALEQGRDAFEAMNHRLWDDQKAWKGSTEPAAVVRGFAKDLGLDLPRYDSCVRENRRGRRIAGANSLAREIGVRGTPTFFIIGYPPLQGALPTDAFVQVLTAVYADATGNGG